MNIGIENLVVNRQDSGDHNNGANIVFDKAVNCWVKSVYSYMTCRFHVLADLSSHIDIDGCFFQSACSYDLGGRGYGVCLEWSTTNCLVENNIFKRLRHAMVAQAGANCNVFSHNYSNE